jgi:hypothetical protein
MTVPFRRFRQSLYTDGYDDATERVDLRRRAATRPVERTPRHPLYQREIGTPEGSVGYQRMKKRRSSSPFALPMMMARLTAASLETIFHRTTMIAMGKCSPAEYRRMVAEKATAAQRSAAALMTGKSLTAAMAPYSTRARANAKRLRKK